MSLSRGTPCVVFIQEAHARGKCMSLTTYFPLIKKVTIMFILQVIGYAVLILSCYLHENYWGCFEQLFRGTKGYHVDSR